MTIGDLTARRSELWEWNGAAWAAVAGGQLDAASPLLLVETATPGEALALEEAPAGAATAATWTWSGTAWARVATTGPPPRFVSAMAFDPARGAILFGGSARDSRRLLGDTWVWDGTAWHAR